jgi:acetyl esterase/lipase
MSLIIRGICVCVLAGTYLFAEAAMAQDSAAVSKKTYTYKTAGDVKIQLDVYRPDDSKVQPVVVWIHGGALVMGNRNSVPRNIAELCKSNGYTLVSIDYRLAPEVKLPEIIADVEDAFTWIRGDGAKQCHLDADRLVVTGGSAGGYLTLMTGVRLKKKPTALVAYWGYGDVDGDWYTKPSEFYRKQPLVSKEDAMKGVGGKVLTGSEAEFDRAARGRYYLYLRQNGLWTKEVTGFDHQTERAKLDPFCPVRNVSPDYPPTMLVHGTDDTDVPYDLSVAMDKELTRHKVPHELVTVRGAGHGLAGGDKKLVADAHEKALAFIQSYLKTKYGDRSWIRENSATGPNEALNSHESSYGPHITEHANANPPTIPRDRRRRVRVSPIERRRSRPRHRHASALFRRQERQALPLPQGRAVHARRTFDAGASPRMHEGRRRGLRRRRSSGAVPGRSPLSRTLPRRRQGKAQGDVPVLRRPAGHGKAHA